MGDAADISCPYEITAVFDALDAETPGICFMAPGSHDGLLAGNLARYQPGFDFEIDELPSLPHAARGGSVKKANELEAMSPPVPVADATPRRRQT